MTNVLIVGSGKRVLEAALPALMCLEDSYWIQGILARTPREVESGGRSFGVERLVDLDQERLSRCDLVYMVVGKGAVPAALRTLCKLDVSRTDLLIDTPVLLFKHMGHLGLLDRFRNTWVPEDCTTLPVFDAVDALLASGALGELQRVILDRSGYAYHAIAMARRLLDAGRVRSARRTPKSAGVRERVVRFERPGELRVIEPRDYSRGRITLEGSAGSLSDDPARGAEHRLAPVLENGECTGFRAGDATSSLDDDERSLIGTARRDSGDEPGVTAWMEGMKRVGFLRLFRRIADGGGAYPLADAIEDTVVDYHLEKIGRYRVNPFTSAHFASARLLMRALTRMVP